MEYSLQPWQTKPWPFFSKSGLFFHQDINHSTKKEAKIFEMKFLTISTKFHTMAKILITLSTGLLTVPINTGGLPPLETTQLTTKLSTFFETTGKFYKYFQTSLQCKASNLLSLPYP